jgi:hypothetical protein
MESDVNKEEAITHEESNDVSGKKMPTISIKSAIILSAVIIALALMFVYKSVFVAAVVNGSPISRLSVIHAIEQKSG